MWSQNYTPVSGSLGLSAAVACLPLIVTLVLLAVFKRPAWLSALAGATTALLVALIVYGMPASMAFSTVGYGAAYGTLADHMDHFYCDPALSPDSGNGKVRNH